MRRREPRYAGTHHCHPHSRIPPLSRSCY
jgi:hypothetical protein